MVRRILTASLISIALGLALQVAAGATPPPEGGQDPSGVSGGPSRTQGSGTR